MFKNHHYTKEKLAIYMKLYKARYVKYMCIICETLKAFVAMIFSLFEWAEIIYYFSENITLE